MVEFIIFVVVIVTVCALPARDHAQRNQLSAGPPEDPETKRKREAEAVMAEPKRYLEGHGFKVVTARGAPRKADVGTLQVEHCRGQHCRYECGCHVFRLEQISPVGPSGSGVDWFCLGRFCMRCGSFMGADGDQRAKAFGLGTRLRDATNVFDVLGPSADEDPQLAWSILEKKENELETALNELRLGKRTLAERLGQTPGPPFRASLSGPDETKTDP